MFKAIASIFGFGNSSNDNLEQTKTHPQVLFDYKLSPNAYLSRCKPVLEKMISCGLINKLSTCKSVEEFGSDKFNSYDMSDVEFARDMLEKINSNPGQIPIGTDEDLTQIVKIIMKKYLMEKSKPTKDKVWIEVNVSPNRKIQVVSYANKTKTGEPRLKDPGGSIEPGETPEEAGVRELGEELGLVVSKSRLEPVDLKGPNYKFKINLDKEELEDYIKHLKVLDIDPEITMICIV